MQHEPKQKTHPKTTSNSDRLRQQTWRRSPSTRTVSRREILWGALRRTAKFGGWAILVTATILLIQALFPNERDITPFIYLPLALVDVGLLSFSVGLLLPILYLVACDYLLSFLSTLLHFKEYRQQRISEHELEQRLKQLRESHVKPKGAARTAMRLTRGDHYHLNEDGEIIFDGQTEKAKHKNSESNQ